MQKGSAEVHAARAGGGNWEAFNIDLEVVFAAASEWKKQLAAVSKPWLCWNVSNRWCLLQQKLVQQSGWTPVVGFDPRVGAPEMAAGAVLVDFNASLKLPVLKPMVPIEFAFLFADRLAFWHSDLLCRLEVMEYLRNLFDSMVDGQTAAVVDKGGLKDLFSVRRHRYWELAGCTTRAASKSQFDCAAGWWRHIECHPNVKTIEERQKREACHWEHGVGIMYWKRYYNGNVLDIERNRVEEGHCTSIGNNSYRRLSPKQYVRHLGSDLDANFDIEVVAKSLGIAHLL